MPRREQLAVILLGSGGLVVAGLVVLLVVALRREVPAPDPAEVARAVARHQGEQVATGPAGSRVPANPALAIDHEPEVPAVASDAAAAPALPVGPGPVQVPAAGLSETMSAATRAYDQADYEVARERALEVLVSEADNARMLRVAISSSCMLGDGDKARELYPRLPERDRDVIQRRCARFGVEF